MLTVVGMGPAGLQWQIPAAREAIAAAEALVGGSRHLQQFPDFAGERFALGADMPALLAWIEARTGRRVVVLASGDPLFYGIGTRLIAHFGRERVQVIPGISAVQYLCARAGIDMNDMWLTSSHGRAVSFDALAAHRKVATCASTSATQPASSSSDEVSISSVCAIVSTNCSALRRSVPGIGVR